MKIILLISIFLSAFWGYGQNIEKETLVRLPEDISKIDEIQLSQIADQLGDARIIGTTERIHGYKEPFIFRNELIKYLVGAKQIDVILLESGLLESRYLNDYIHQKQSSLDLVRLNGFSSGKQTIPENIEILEWLRNYNSDPKNLHKVDIYGFDISGSMGAGTSRSEMNTPIKTLVSYLEKASFDRDTNLIEKLKPLTDSLKIKPFAPNQENLPTYDKLNRGTRNEVTSILNDLIANLEIYRFEYIANTSQEEYDWAYIAAISARNIDNVLRKLPLPGEIMTPEKIDDSFFARLNGMVQNVEYLLNRNPEAKFFIFAASNHLFKHPFETYWPGSQEGVSLPITVGTYLASQYPSDYKLVGHFYLNAENEKNNLKEDPAIFSNHLVNNSKNYFIPVMDLNKLNIDEKMKIDQGAYIIPSKSFDYILFTENITEHQRRK
ncbi:erythromycin esterase family protein [Echinicola shivajiensis]|uniref:erythromycin esterase family protein n=1 Tax=Echinicola shivajiensis TaxID=1035916 RepID=UPI001BFC7A72|nr:erythromycin esterase family protein [Echinicola shivajiensis]